MIDKDKFDAIIDINDPDFAVKLSEAIGLQSGDVLNITTPQFERTDGLQPIADPTDVIKSLHKLNKETLLKIGMQPWGHYGLWLFPYQWYEFIPEGMQLMCIDGSTENFQKGVTDDEMRFGALAYGIVPEFEKANEPSPPESVTDNIPPDDYDPRKIT